MTTRRYYIENTTNSDYPYIVVASDAIPRLFVAKSEYDRLVAEYPNNHYRLVTIAPDGYKLAVFDTRPQRSA